jgi:hypothetical protein
MGAALLVIPAQAGIQFLPTWMCVFSACRTKGGFARFQRASYFPFGESSQSHCARHDGLDNVQLSRLPCASRAKRAGANSHVPVLGHSRLAPAWRCAARRHARARTEPRFDGGHPWPASSGLADLRAMKSGVLKHKNSPVVALPACVVPRSRWFALALNEAMDGRQQNGLGAFALRRSAQPSARARRACPRPRMAEFASARARRAPRVVSATRCCRNRSAKRNGFGYFCRNKSSPLAAASGTAFGKEEFAR